LIPTLNSKGIFKYGLKFFEYGCLAIGCPMGHWSTVLEG